MNLWLLLACLLCLALVAPGRASAPTQPGLSPSISEPAGVRTQLGPAVELSRLENSVRPSVIWVSVFDSSGKLLRTQTGFFISADGRLVTSARAIENGINAVVKTADGGIYNINGILAASTLLDLAILQADVKRVASLTLNPNANLTIGARVAVVGSALAGSEGAPREATISNAESDRFEIAAAISPMSIGSAVVDASGAAAGIVVSAGGKAVVRPSSSIEELLAQIASNATAKWPETGETRVTPKPKPHLVYAPEPSFPPGLSWRGVSASGRFRLAFDARGKVTNVQILHSTGNELFDQSAVNTLRQWKCSPGQEWALTVPVTFQTR